CYDIGHLYTAAHFLDRRLVKPPLFIQSVFGIRGGIGPHPEDVMHMKRTADRLFGDQYLWSVLGAGRNQMFVAAMSAVMGGNVRVGLEDSLWLGRGTLAKSNAEQVTKIRRILEELGLQIATADIAATSIWLRPAPSTDQWYASPNRRSAVRFMCSTSSGCGPMPPRMPNTDWMKSGGLTSLRSRKCDAVYRWPMS